MNDDFNENDLGQPASSGGQTSFNGFGQFGGINSSFNAGRKEDIKSINERGKNEDVRRPVEEPEEKSTSSKGSSLDDEKEDISDSKKEKNEDSKSGKKESDNKNDLKDKDSKDKDSDKKDDKKSKGNASSDDKDDGINGLVKSKLLKYKMYFIIGGVAVGVFAIFFMFFAIMTAIDNLTLGLVSFFGVPESEKSETGNLDGLYDSDKYKYDENGNEMNRDELLNYLDRNSSCEGNFWTSISDGWNSLWGLDIKDFCELLRYIEKETKKYDVDQSLIFSTIFYGYDTRPTAEQYYKPEDVPAMSNTTEHYQSLLQVLQDENIHITRQGLNELIKNSHAIKKSYYYAWTIEPKTNNEGKVTSITGKCVYKEMKTDKYNLDKWKMFMRFGSEVAAWYEEIILKKKNYEASSEECKDEGYTEENLRAQVMAAARTYGDDVTYSLNMNSVYKARTELGKPEETNDELFLQKANVDTKTKDIFTPYNEIEFDYRNGYAYQNFPPFKPSMEEGGAYYGKVNIHYDDIFTPKEIEQLILDIVDRKTNMNHALNRTDPDEPEDYQSGLGGYTGVPTGANCMPYLPASLSEIKVDLTDCLGVPMATVTFEDYIIGVANGEVSNKNDDYVKAQMVAAISYALRRHNNYTKNPIRMRSGNCDQVYCSMMKGCTSKTTPINGDDRFHSYYIGGSKAYPQLYPKYQALYAEASDYLLVKDGTVFNAHYINTSQNRWYQKAISGMSFTQIMQEEYAAEGATLIRCSNGGSTPADPDNPEDDGNKVGNKPTEEYPKVSPDKGIYYGFSYRDESDGTHITINPEWKNENLVTVSPVCSGNSAYENKKYTIHKKAVNSFEKAFKKVCTLLTSGVKISTGETCKYTIDDVQDGTVFIERKTSGGTFDLHPYGIAQDLNYSKTITVNGTSYQPYNTRDLSKYLEFVNAIGGKEENCKNVNYILWAYAYKDAGFYWGGNYGRNGNAGTFDGKLFELKYN